MDVVDQMNRALTFNHPPKRIISLVPSLSELLCDLGLEESIVGVTKFCVHPCGLIKEKVVVGGTKRVKFDKIRELRPDIIITNKEENTKEIIAKLETQFPVHISDIYNIDDCLEIIRMYGDIFLVEQKASNLIFNLESALEDFKLFIHSTTNKKVAYFIWKEPWMIAASNTFINQLLTLNKFENYFSSLARYPEIELDSIDENDLDFIFLSSEPYPFTEKHIMNLEKRFPNSEIVLVNGEMFSWYGSRLLLALDYFKELNNTIR